MGNYKFDLDLPEGEAAERLVKEILCGEHGTVEVKRDFEVSSTGNIAIEYRSRGHKSGIATTTAKWWAITLDGAQFGHEIIILIRTERLKVIAREWYKNGGKRQGGDNRTSGLVVIPVGELVKPLPTGQPELV